MPKEDVGQWIEDILDKISGIPKEDRNWYLKDEIGSFEDQIDELEDRMVELQDRISDMTQEAGELSERIKTREYAIKRLKKELGK